MLAGLISLLSSILPLLIRVHGVASGQQGGSAIVDQIRDGFRFVSRHPILPGLFLLDAGITTASFYREILPVLALGMFAGGASATGMLGAANSTGAIAIALFLVGYRAKGMLVLYASLAGLFSWFTLAWHVDDRRPRCGRCGDCSGQADDGDEITCAVVSALMILAACWPIWVGVWASANNR